MSPLTSPQNFRYPALTDTPNVPRDIQALAVDIGAYIDTHPGPQGIQGTTGIQGLIGTQGLQGRQGTQGTNGLQGTTGLQGFTGSQGTNGLQGTTGSQGLQGLTGTGIQGPAGSVQGTQGVQGLQGGGFNQLQGTQGLQGQAGSVQGLQGVQGPSGATILGSANTFTSSNTFTPSTSVNAVTINQASSSKGLIVKANATTPGNLTEWQDSSGAALLSVSSSGVLNPTGTTNIGPVLTFANPGVGGDTRFNFTKSSDQAWLSVVERASDSTYYEFGLADNPTATDYFQWKFDNYEAPAQGWMPLQIGAMTTRFTSAVSNWGSYSIPVNTPFTTLNASATSSADFQINKYAPTNSTTYSLNKDSGTGTGTVTLNAQSFTGSSRTGYWISIDAGATTFTWGIGYTNNTPTATGVSITGSAQTLNNGVTVTLSLTGHVAGDKWSFLCFPRPTVGIGGAPLLTSMHTIYPFSGVVGSIIKAAVSQTANLQEWQDSSSTILSKIDASGNITAPSLTLSTTPLAGASGGTGVANTGKTITLGGNLTTSGAYATTLTATNTTSVILPTSGTLATLAGTETLTNKTLAYNVNLQTGTTYTFALTDAASVVLLSNASAITASIPTDASVAFAVGSTITIIQTGAGQVTIQATTPATTTILSNAITGTAPKLRGAGSSATLIKISANNWYVIGDLY